MNESHSYGIQRTHRKQNLQNDEKIPVSVVETPSDLTQNSAFDSSEDEK